MFFSKFVIATHIALVIIPLSVMAMPPLEENAISIRKDYWNKNKIHMSCSRKESRICDMSVTANNKKKKIRFDFSKYNLAPNFEQIGIIPTSESGNEFYFYVGVDCSDEDIEMIPESINNAECVARFKIVDGEVVEIPQVQIYPIATQNLYREIKMP